MLNAYQIPDFTNFTEEGVRTWWDQIISLGLNMHPDDDPANLVSIATGKCMLTPEACQKVRAIHETMFKFIGDKIYDIGTAAYMGHLGYVFDHESQTMLPQPSTSS